MCATYDEVEIWRNAQIQLKFLSDLPEDVCHGQTRAAAAEFGARAGIGDAQVGLLEGAWWAGEIPWESLVAMVGTAWCIATLSDFEVQTILQLQEGEHGKSLPTKRERQATAQTTQGMYRLHMVTLRIPGKVGNQCNFWIHQRSNQYEPMPTASCHDRSFSTTAMTMAVAWSSGLQLGHGNTLEVSLSP